MMHFQEGSPTIVWTDKAEVDILTEAEHKVAFKDILLEKLVRNMFDVYMKSCKMGEKMRGRGQFPLFTLIKDPQPIYKNVTFDKAQAGETRMSKKHYFV